MISPDLLSCALAMRFTETYVVENALGVIGPGKEDSAGNLALRFAARQGDVLRAVEDSGSRHWTASSRSAP
jgi:hypothetical protein